MRNFRNENINIHDIIEIIKSENYDLDFVKIPLFELPPKKFLAFAKSDMKDNTEKGLVNAISNAKRAIACRNDELLKLAYLEKISQKNRWNIPIKMKNLNIIGISVPGILQRRITLIRNFLEHNYIIPSDSSKVKDIIDIAELFIGSTEKYVEFGLLASLNERENRYIIFNITKNIIEIYTKHQKNIINLSQIEEKDLLDLAKQLTELRTDSDPQSYTFFGEKNWEDYYSYYIKAHKLNEEGYLDGIE